MSEQRFVLDKLYYTIMTPIEKISVGRCYMTYGEVVDLLNEQQTTIENLRKRVKELEIENEALQDSNDALAEDMFHRLEEVI